MEFESIPDRVKFVAGNYEYYLLEGFQKFERMEGNKYVFAEGHYKKTVTFEQMCLIYKYLNHCHGVIYSNKKDNEKVGNFVNSLYFRHSILLFDPKMYKPDLFIQDIPISLDDYNKAKFILVVGHNKLFANPQTESNKRIFYMIDPNTLEDIEIMRSNIPREIYGLGQNDYRLAIVDFDDKVGFFVKPFVFPGQSEFIQWDKIYTYKQLTCYNSRKRNRNSGNGPNTSARKTYNANSGTRSSSKSHDKNKT